MAKCRTFHQLRANWLLAGLHAHLPHRPKTRQTGLYEDLRSFFHDPPDEVGEVSR